MNRVEIKKSNTDPETNTDIDRSAFRSVSLYQLRDPALRLNKLHYI